MALGPGFFYNRYKNNTIDELQNVLKEINKKEYKKHLKQLRKQQIADRIDDNNVWSDWETKLDVIKTLIEYKTMYQYSDLSDCDDFFLVKQAIKNQSGPIDIKNDTKESCGLDYEKVLDDFFPPKMPIID